MWTVYLEAIELHQRGDKSGHTNLPLIFFYLAVRSQPGDCTVHYHSQSQQIIWFINSSSSGFELLDMDSGEEGALMSLVHLAATWKDVLNTIILIKKHPSNLELNYLWPTYIHLYLCQNGSLGYIALLFFPAAFFSMMHLSELNKLNF